MPHTDDTQPAWKPSTPRQGERLRIVVGGYIGLLPYGGVTWDYLQYPLGLHEMGHDVYYIEDTCQWPTFEDKADWNDCSSNVNCVADAMKAVGMGDRWAYRDIVTEQWFGMDRSAAEDILKTADVLINVSCSTYLSDLHRQIPVRVLIDSDPMFTQVQCCTGQGFTNGSEYMMEAVHAHTHHFTFGENIGATDCRVPNIGITWHPTRQPICLAHWADAPPIPRDGRLTTLMNWSVGDPLVYDGQQWGQKNVEFLKLMGLPRQVESGRLAVAVNQTTGSPFPAEQAQQGGWTVLKPSVCAADWRSYRQFIFDSLGECSVAKHTYVAAKTGWFSCRSACYLASGRPVVVQDTGWSRYYPTGQGLFAFDDAEQAAEAINRILADPVTHSRAARALAEEHFDAGRVLKQLIDQI